MQDQASPRAQPSYPEVPTIYSTKGLQKLPSNPHLESFLPTLHRLIRTAHKYILISFILELPLWILCLLLFPQHFFQFLSYRNRVVPDSSPQTISVPFSSLEENYIKSNYIWFTWNKGVVANVDWGLVVIRMLSERPTLGNSSVLTALLWSWSLLCFGLGLFD